MKAHKAAALEPLEITVLEIRDGQCRWPVGEPERGRHTFCGHKVRAGKLYCEHHHAKSVDPNAKPFRG